MSASVRTRKTLLTTSLFMLAVAPARLPGAAETTWDGNVELGYVQTGGNTDTTSLVGKFKVARKGVRWDHGARFDGYKATDSGTVTAENYTGVWRSEFHWRDVDYLYGLLRYEDNRFAGYDRRTSEILGYGYRILRRDDLKLRLEVGAGARQTKFTDGSTDSNTTGRLGGWLEWGITETTQFTQTLFTEASSANTYTESISELKLKVNASLAVKLGYIVKHNSDVPPGVENTDTLTTVTLNYDF